MESQPTEKLRGEPIGDSTGPLREPLMPQISIRSQIVLITVSAILMVVAQQAIFHERLWAILILVGLAQLVAVFALYALSFAMANLFSKISSAAMAPLPEEKRFTPTLAMPPEWSASLPNETSAQTAVQQNADQSAHLPGHVEIDAPAMDDSPSQDPPSQATES